MLDEHGDIGDDDFVRRYVTGELGAAERASFEQRLTADPILAHVVSQLLLAWEAARRPPFEVTSAETAAALARLKACLRARSDVAAAAQHGRVLRPPNRPHPPRKRGAAARAPLDIRRWTAIAAAALLFAAGAVRLTSGDRAVWRHSFGSAESRPTIASAPMREWLTGRGQQVRLALSDGSIVTVAPQSRVRMRPTFGTTADSVRDVYLEGEAYFVVSHDVARPFRVHAAGAVTEDVGTAFLVTAYPDTRGSRVVVTEGSVRLPRAGGAFMVSGDQLTLTRGDVARVPIDGETHVTRTPSPERFVAWTRGVLILDGTRLGDAVPVLERWYDVDIALADPALADVRVTAELRVESSERMIDRLATALGVRARISGRAVMLLPTR